jgi:hypothetical protein
METDEGPIKITLQAIINYVGAAFSRDFSLPKGSRLESRSHRLAGAIAHQNQE